MKGWFGLVSLERLEEEYLSRASICTLYLTLYGTYFKYLLPSRRRCTVR